MEWDSPERNSQRFLSVSDSRASNTAAPTRRYVNVHTTSDSVLTFCLFIFAVLPLRERERVTARTYGALQNKKFNGRAYNEFPEIFPDGNVPRDRRHLYGSTSPAHGARANIYLSPDKWTSMQRHLYGISGGAHVREIGMPRELAQYSQDNNRCTLLSTPEYWSRTGIVEGETEGMRRSWFLPRVDTYACLRSRASYDNRRWRNKPSW